MNANKILDIIMFVGVVWQSMLITMKLTGVSDWSWFSTLVPVIFYIGTLGVLTAIEIEVNKWRRR